MSSPPKKKAKFENLAEAETPEEIVNQDEAGKLLSLPDSITHFSDPDITTYLQRLEKSLTEMSESEFFQEVLRRLECGILSHQQDGGEKDFFFKRIVCFGLGRITNKFNSLYQFAFMVNLQRHYNIKTVIVYDPCFSRRDKAIFAKFNVKVLNRNCSGRFKASCSTLFYMPFCPIELMNNLLMTNWSIKDISNVLLIGTSFKRIVTIPSQHFLESFCGYINKIHPYARVVDLSDYKLNTKDGLEFMTLHTFSPEIMPKEEKFWVKQLALNSHQIHECQFANAIELIDSDDSECEYYE